MSRDVTEKVVQARFDNQSYEKNAKKTLKTNKQLEESWKFKGSRKELKEFSKELDNINTEKANKQLDETNTIFTRIKLTLSDAIKHNLVTKWADQIVNAGKKAVKGIIGLQNAMEGWSKYETQITNIGGILNSVEKDYEDHATALAAVTAEMEKLQWYSDETSFSFSTLSTGIKQFTTAGISLEKSSQAAMGVTTLAGASKVFDQYKVQSAMDAVAKAMQTGYMDLMKWTSLTNTAGIVTEEFSQILLETAAAQGKLVKSQGGQYKTKTSGKLVTTENIRNSLSDKWLTGDVLTAALARYSSAVDAVRKFQEEELWSEAGPSDEIASMAEALGITDTDNITLSETIKLMESLGYAFDEVGKKALMSSYEATSFSQVMTATKDAVATQWMNIWTAIFGDADEATELWTDMSNLLYRVFVPAFSSAVDILNEWHELSYEEGGYQSLRNTLLNLVKIVDRVREVIFEAFSEVFGEFDAERIGEIVKRFENWTENLYKNERVMKTIKGIVKALLTLLKSATKILGKVFEVVGKLFRILEPALTVLEDFIDEVMDLIVQAVDWLDESGALETAVQFLAGAFQALFDVLKALGNWIKNSKFFQTLSKGIKDAKEAFSNNKFSTGFKTFFTSTAESIKDGFETVKTVTKDATNGFIKSGFYITLKDALKTLGILGDEMFRQIDEKILGFAERVKNGEVTLEEVGKALLKFAKTLITIKLILSTVRIVKGFSNVLDGLADVFWQASKLEKSIRKNLRVKRLATYTLVLVEIAATALMLGITLNKLADFEWKSKWQGFTAFAAILVIVISAIAAVAAIMSKSTSRLSDITGAFKLLGIAEGLSLVVFVFIKMINKINLYNPKQVWNAVIFFAAVSAILDIAILSARWGNKGTPLLMSYMKILLALAGVMAMILGVVKVVTAIGEEKFDHVVNTILKIMGGMVAMVIAIAVTSQFIKRKEHNMIGAAQAVGILMAAVSACALMIYFLTKDNWFLAATSYDAAFTTVVALLGVLTAMSILMMVCARVIKPNAASIQNYFVPPLRSIFMSVLMLAGIVLAIAYMERYITISKMALTTVGILLTIIGAISVLLSTFGKVLKRNKGGIKGLWSGSGEQESGYRLGSSLLGIVLAVAALVGTIWLTSYLIKKGEIGWNNQTGQAVAMIAGMLILICGSLALVFAALGKIGDSSTVRFARTMLITIAVIIGELIAAMLVVKYCKVSWEDILKVVVLIDGFILILSVLALALSVLSIKKSTYNAGDVGAILSITLFILLSIAALVAAVMLLKGDIEGMKSVMTALGIMIFLLGAIVMGIMAVSAVADTKSILAASLLIVSLAGMFAALAAAFLIIKDIDSKKALESALILVGAISVLLLVFVGIAALLGMGDARLGTVVLDALAVAIALVAVALVAVSFGLLMTAVAINALIQASLMLNRDKLSMLEELLGVIAAFELGTMVSSLFKLLGGDIVSSITKLINTVNTLDPGKVDNLKRVLDIVKNFTIPMSKVTNTQYFVDFTKDIKEAVKNINGMRISQAAIDKFNALIGVLNAVRDLNNGSITLFNAEALIQEIQKLDGINANITVTVTPVLAEGSLDKMCADITSRLAGSIQLSYQSASAQGNVDNSVTNSNNVYTVNINGQDATGSSGPIDWISAQFNKISSKISNFVTGK